MLHRLRLYDQRNYAVNICLSKDTKKRGKIRKALDFFPPPNHPSLRWGIILQCGVDKVLFPPLS